MAPVVSNSYKEQKKQEILDSALKCFGRKGFEPTTVDEICAESGVSKGAIYNYFKSKDEIYLELVSQKTEQAFELTRNALDQFQTTVEKLDYLFSIYDRPFPFELESVGDMLVGAEFKIRSFRYPEINEFLTKRRHKFFLGYMIQVLKDGQEAGEVKPDIDAKVHAEMFWSMVDGLVFQIVYKDYPFNQVLKEMREMYYQKVLV
ncbi:TetR/AcrR family transcriptional regulator [Pseudoneobacillus sp. C159]